MHDNCKRRGELWGLMCWGFKVFFKVFGNLAGRIFADTVDASYKMCTIWFCNRNNVSTQSCTDNKIPQIFACETEEVFYQAIDRSRAEVLLTNKQNGTFLVRPSVLPESLGTMSIIQDSKIFHLNVRKRQDNMIALGTEKANEKCFRNLNSLIDYHVSNYLVLFSEGETYRTLLLPYHE